MSLTLRAHGAMLLFSMLVAGSFSLGVLIANDIAPMALNAARFVIAAVVIGLVACFGIFCSTFYFFFFF